MKLYQKQVFSTISSQYNFLSKIQQYHDEIGFPIHVSVKHKQVKNNYSTSTTLFSNIQNNLEPHHIVLVKQYLPATIYKIAYDTYMRRCYHETKLQIAFLQGAMEQIQEYDPFYLTMDDIHEMDMVWTSLSYKLVYYREKI